MSDYRYDKLDPEQKEAWDALLEWLDGGGDKLTTDEDSRAVFDMCDVGIVSTRQVEDGTYCGTSACIGGYLGSYINLFLTPKGEPDLVESLEEVGLFMGMSDFDQQALFFRWPSGYARDTKLAAARVRAFLETGEARWSKALPDLIDYYEDDLDEWE